MPNTFTIFIKNRRSRFWREEHIKSIEPKNNNGSIARPSAKALLITLTNLIGHSARALKGIKPNKFRQQSIPIADEILFSAPPLSRRQGIIPRWMQKC